MCMRTHMHTCATVWVIMDLEEEVRSSELELQAIVNHLAQGLNLGPLENQKVPLSHLSNSSNCFFINETGKIMVTPPFISVS